MPTKKHVTLTEDNILRIEARFDSWLAKDWGNARHAVRTLIAEVRDLRRRLAESESCREEITRLRALVDDQGEGPVDAQ